ncbi:MAG: hypothetical protein WDM90_02075 [Ferruginibacter sp.]
MMGATDLLIQFMAAAREDARIGVTHIGVYVSLLTLWHIRNRETPLPVFSHEAMPYCKLLGPATYHRTIRQLAEYGYIRYVPSYNHLLGSLVWVEVE